MVRHTCDADLMDFGLCSVGVENHSGLETAWKLEDSAAPDVLSRSAPIIDKKLAMPPP